MNGTLLNFQEQSVITLETKFALCCEKHMERIHYPVLKNPQFLNVETNSTYTVIELRFKRSFHIDI